MSKLIKVLSKSAQAKLWDKPITELLDEALIYESKDLTEKDKLTLLALREAVVEYHTLAIKGVSLTSTDKAGSYIQGVIAQEKEENLVCVFLNAKNEVIELEKIFKGTVNSSIVAPQEIFREAVKYPATSIIIGHNHPSGDLTPSRGDLEATKRLILCGDMMGIQLLDHFIVSPRGYNSLRETTTLW